MTGAAAGAPREKTGPGPVFSFPGGSRAGRGAVIALLTDFSERGPYVGEMLSVLAREAPGVPSFSLMCDLPAFDPAAAAYLLAPLVLRQPEGSVFVAVVDPGVGTPARRPVWLEADGRTVVGPDNGLLEVLARRARDARLHEILWRPRRLSASFHGRDLFAPVAARLALARPVRARALRRRFAWSRRWPPDRDRVIYVDGYGNCMTGRRAATVERAAAVRLGASAVRHARTFGEVPPGEALWYENSLGLLEVACNRESAAVRLGATVGTLITVG